MGYDDRLMESVGTEEIRSRQRLVYRMLSIIIFTLSVLCAVSSVVYMLIIFHSWFIALLVGIFLGLVVFNLNGLIVITAFGAHGTTLAEYFNDHDRYFREHLDPDEDLRNMSDEILEARVKKARMALERLPTFDIARKPSSFDGVFTMSIRVLFLMVLAILFSTGIEILIFRSQINGTLEELLMHYRDAGDTWMVNEVLSPKDGKPFTMIQSNSILLVVELLCSGLGNWKVLIDLVFMAIFITPLMIVFRSREFREGEYIRAYVLSSLSISFRHHLITRRYCQQLDEAFRSTEGLILPGSVSENTVA